MSASLIPRIGSSSSSSSSSPKQRYCSYPICLISNLHFSNSIPQLGIYKISTWNGLKQLNVNTSRCILKIERKRRCKGVYASLFGVGAPEALVIGVVALLVFGPKGLAEVARNLGKTLRDFQPTIRELQEVSRDFKSTLEREIGLDEIQETTRPTPSTRPTAKPEDFVKANTPTDVNSAENKAYTNEEYLTSFTEQLRKQRENDADESQPKEQEDGSPTSIEESLGGEDMKISEEPVEVSAAELQVSDGSVFSKEAETQEYLKQLEEQVQALLAEKQKISASAAEVKTQDTSAFSTEASFTEDNVKSTEQGLEELPAQPHEETPPPTESQDKPQSESEEGTLTSMETETLQHLKKVEDEPQDLLIEKQKQTVIVPEDTGEAASLSSPSLNSENQA